MKRVEVVMVLYGERRPPRAALEALEASEGVSVGVTIVDHGPPGGDSDPGADRDSSSGSERDPGSGSHEIIEAENRGFGAGVNLGVDRVLRARRPDYLFIMNHDVRVAPNTLWVLASALDSLPRAGVVGPMILVEGESDLVWNAGSDIEWPSARPRSRLHGESAAAVPRNPYASGYLAGCALLVRPDAFERAGGFAEDYFLYFEDADFACRLGRVGLESIVVPDARVWHRAGSATSRRPDLARFLRVRNRLLFSRRWGPRGIRLVMSRLAFTLRKLFGDPIERRAALLGTRAEFDESDYDR